MLAEMLQRLDFWGDNYQGRLWMNRTKQKVGRHGGRSVTGSGPLGNRTW